MRQNIFVKKNRGYPKISFFHVDINDSLSENVDINKLDVIDDKNTTNINGDRITCFEMENGTEQCTSNDDTKPHLTLNSHIISATLRRGLQKNCIYDDKSSSKKSIKKVRVKKSIKVRAKQIDNKVPVTKLIKVQANKKRLYINSAKFFSAKVFFGQTNSAKRFFWPNFFGQIWPN